MRHKSRFSIWIPRRHRWLIDAIYLVRREAETQGIPLSEGDVIILCLTEYLKKYKSDEEMLGAETIGTVDTTKTELKRSLVCRKKDVWILEYLDKVVAVKNIAGIRTSFSYEVMRLLRSALLSGPLAAKYRKFLK